METSDQAESETSRPDASSREAQPGGEQDDATASRSRSQSVSSESSRPPLPPRPTNIEAQDEETTSASGSPHLAKLASKQNLQSKATTALSLPEISSNQAFPDDSKEANSSALEKAGTLSSFMNKAGLSQMASRRGSDAGDTASIRSYIPSSAAAGDLESIFGDFPGVDHEKSGWNSGAVENFDSFDLSEFQGEDTDFDFSDEFEPVGELDPEGHNEGMLSIAMLDFVHSL